MTSIDYLRRNGQPNHSEQIDNINIYDLASTLYRKGNPADSADAPKVIVVGKRFKVLAKKSYEPAKWYSVRILPNIISDLEAGFLNLNDNLAEQLLGLRLNCLHSLKKNDFGFDRIFISLLK